MFDTKVGAIGQADDTVLVSSNLHHLQDLLNLSLHYCGQQAVELCVEKTKLQAFAPSTLRVEVEHNVDKSPITIAGDKIKCVESAEHVGIVCSVTGNLPNLLDRLTAYRRAMGAVLHTGM